ncbi:hypothetical protein ACUN7V_16530 [Quadrisphaera oryzae]|uniref:hypothetical protein n=1 Tax=Quadrisphaera TaxID=317661 RepID=UPI001647DDCA|nr:hypothetical protein [Quadrisphaera sp. RL12-1S]MBC3760882.1 hypothetical protein [Quadrisphaera sp. RL12-1S]
MAPSRPAPRRLVTSVTPDPEVASQPEHQLSARALLELELADGARVVLLDDRGWTSSTGRSSSIWASTTREDVEETARTVVGPDGPVHGGTWEQAVAASWSHLADVAVASGVAVGGPELASLPHDVVVDATLLARLSPGPPVG